MAKKDIIIEQTENSEEVKTEPTMVLDEKKYTVDVVFGKKNDKKHFHRKDEKY